MPKNIVILNDGTGNEIGSAISNVLKLYRMLRKDERQRVFYNPGVGTIGLKNAWQRLKQRLRGVFGLATGYGLDDDVLQAYRFLCATYERGDSVWLFGFSRGAYTVRVLAALTHVIGLLPPDQANLAGYAFTAYKASSADSRSRADDDTGGGQDHSASLQAAWEFARIAGAYPIQIDFVGVWDTVASVIVPRSDVLLPDIQTLRFTRTNPCVRVFRQAIAIDERRRMFRLNRWLEPQVYRANPYSKSSEVAQDVRQVWFAGVHADIGGGYPEAQSGASKYPLIWLVEEAMGEGLSVDQAMFNRLALGHDRPGGEGAYVAPCATARLHDSLTWAWWILEWLPKRVRWRECSSKRALAGWYLPRGEPRRIPDGAVLHSSVVERMAADDAYRPSNLPASYAVTTGRPASRANEAFDRVGTAADPGAHDGQGSGATEPTDGEHRSGAGWGHAEVTQTSDPQS